MAQHSASADSSFKLRSLAQASIFNTTSEDDLAEIARCGKMIAIARGKPVNPSTNPDMVFLVQSGVIAGLQADHKGTKPVLTALFGPGSICGIQTALTHKASITNDDDDLSCEAEARCLTNVSAIAIPLSDILRIARRSPELAEAAMIQLANHTDETAKLLAQSLRRPLELRLANVFTRIGDLIAGEDWRPTVAIGKISQSFAAEMLGVSREHVNRTLTMWEKSGLIFQNKSGEILIQNRKRHAVLASNKTAAPETVKDGDWIWEIDSHLDYGLNQAAYHLAMEAAKRAPKDMRFRHRAILATARSGAMEEALALIDRLDLKHDYSDEELGCLRPRILRDMAFNTDNDNLKRKYLVDSAEEYAKVFEKCRTSYSGINAAYGYAMLDENDKAKGIASVVSGIAQAILDPLDEDENSYWLRTTIAECKLLQNDLPAAASQLQAASAAPDVTPGKKAATRRQLFRVSSHLGIDHAWIDRSIPQKGTLYFSGPLAGKSDDETDDLIDDVLFELKDYIRKNPIGWACGALASGCDIAIAEVLLEQKVSLSVYLPLSPNDFMKSSVSAFGEKWKNRFTDCMRSADSIEWNRRAPIASGPTYQLGALAAMGKVIRHAEELQTQAHGFFAAQEGLKSDRSLSVKNMEVWQGLDLPFIDARGVWPKKEITPAKEVQDIFFSVTLQQTGKGSLPKKPMQSAHSVIALPESDCIVYLFESQVEAASRAKLLSETKASNDFRIWLDVGIFNVDPKENTKIQAVENLITASCRPLTDPGKIVTSETFACAAATSLPASFRFEYIGYTNAQEKLDPCPLHSMS